MEFKVGSVVVSKAGRDKGYFLAVVQITDKGIYVCDGKERPVERPKLKNPVHLALTHYSLSPTQMSANRALCRALNDLKTCKKGR